MGRGNLCQKWLSGSSLELSCFWHLVAGLLAQWFIIIITVIIITCFRQVEEQ